MATSGLRVKDRLDGGGNWTPWKARIVLLLKECELWELVGQVVILHIDPILLAEFKKKNVRAKRIILDLVKDHIIPHVVGKDFAFQMWESFGEPLLEFEPEQEDGAQGQAEKHQDGEGGICDILPHSSLLGER